MLAASMSKLMSLKQQEKIKLTCFKCNINKQSYANNVSKSECKKTDQVMQVASIYANM